jgi:N-acetylglucosaminyl-diphospho-decaprenol L-rhamnosyltransferase
MFDCLQGIVALYYRRVTMASVSLTAVIVAHNSLEELRRTLPPLLAQLGPADELIIVDNASTDDLRAALTAIAPEARLVEMGRNAGFASGVNAGAAVAAGELLVLLNPDVIVEHGWSEAIRTPWGGRWAAWMGMVALEDGDRINTSGGVLHFTGFGWAGQIGEPLGAGPSEPSQVGFLSGACLAIPRQTWNDAQGFPERFFMYCEDVDLSLRLRLIGGEIAVIPDARVRHSYEFVKGGFKWRLLERNRWATIIRTYPAPLLLVAGPALLGAELAVWLVAARAGWARMKLLATVDLARELPALLRERRAIQAAATISPGRFAEHLVATLDSPYFGAVGRQPLLRSALAGYWRVARRLLDHEPSVR